MVCERRDRQAPKLNAQQITALLYEAGLRDRDALIGLTSIALRESSGQAGAHNYCHDTNDDSRGLFQINIASRADGFAQNANLGYRDRDLFDPRVNAATAVEMFKNNNGFSPWSVARQDDPSLRAAMETTVRAVTPIVDQFLGRPGGPVLVNFPSGDPVLPLPPIPGGDWSPAGLVDRIFGTVPDIAGGLVDTSKSVGSFFALLGRWVFDARNWWRAILAGAAAVVFVIGAGIYTRANFGGPAAVDVRG